MLKHLGPRITHLKSDIDFGRANVPFGTRRLTISEALLCQGYNPHFIPIRIIVQGAWLG